MIGVVVSRADEASVAIGDALLDEVDWELQDDDAYVRRGFELRRFDDLHLELDGVADAFDDPELVVFVSRHAGETGPLLTAHFTGNAGPAEYGGRANELAAACPNALARVLASLDRSAPEGYDGGIECTHHGPSAVGAPSMFVEVGSGEPQWRDADAAAAVARAVLDLEEVSPGRERTVAGFGGGHYAPRFLRVLRETDWAVGHVIADWAIEAADGLTPEVIDQVFERSDTTRALIDGDRPELAEAIEDRGYEVVSETWLRETVGVPLDLVAAAESSLCSVDDGLRFGDRRAEAIVVDRLHPRLVDDALGVDPEAAVEAFDSCTVAYETEEAGNRPTGRMCLPADGSLDPVVEALADVLRSGGATVDREGDDLVVRESRFDPEAAATLGVPEGPAFGRLADGQPVTVDGETIRPEVVHSETSRRYPVRSGES